MAETNAPTNLTPQEQRARLLKLLARKELETKYAPLSFSQERFWIEEQLTPGSINSLSFTARIAGPLNVSVLEQSLTEIVRRHEVLRTTVVVVNGQPRQSIKPAQPFQLPVISIEQTPAAERELEAQRAVRAELNRPFDIARGPLFRAELLRLDPADHILILLTQHLVSDAWSLGILIHELSVLYGAFAQGQPSPLPPLPWQYADFAQWQRQKMQGEVLERELAYWTRRLSDSSSILALPTDRPCTTAPTTRGAHEPVLIPVSLREQLKALAQREGCTLFMVLLAGLQTLLYRYTAQADINVCTVVANRTHNAAERLIGLFLNMLVLRANLHGNPTFLEMLQRARQITLEAYDHQQVPFQRMLEALHLQPHFVSASLFQVLLLLQNVPTPTVDLPGLACQRYLREMDFQSEMDLSISLVETEEGLVGYLEYKTELFEAATLRRLLGHYQTLLHGIVANPQQPIDELPVLTGDEEQQLLLDWNATAADYPRGRSLPEIFAEQVARTPDALALVCEQQHLTYHELDQRATALAHHLRARGVGPETLVGLCLERTPDLIVGLLGILKAGGAYVPLDPIYLAQRLDFIVQDTGLTLLLTHSSLAPQLAATGASLVLIDQLPDSLAQAGGALPGELATSEQLAYIIYTSGSTGRPKGVMISQRSLVQYATAAIRHFHLTSHDRVLQFASISFDAAAEEIFPTLLCGATLVLRTDRLLDSPEMFWRECAANGLTVLDLPTAVWHTLIAQWNTARPDLPDTLRLIILGGEAAIADWVAVWHQHTPPHIRLINTYGPTETTIVATTCTLTPDQIEQVPIGRPVANTTAYVLDPRGQPVPINVAGELHLGGLDLARGYFQRPALTAERFVPDPFSSTPGARLYKTGDLARYLPDGQLQFLGRVDRQVKIRGFRIEPGEIETVVRRHPAVQDAVVVARAEKSEKHLIAYVVPKAQNSLTASDLRSFLQNRLPAYMIPATFITLDVLPLTSSGKLDHNALPAPDFTPERSSYVPPTTPVEEKLVEIWAETLPVKQIGLHDNFFELGGHSLMATQVIYRINQAYHLDLPLRALFEEPTVAGLGLLIEEHLLTEIAGQPASE